MHTYIHVSFFFSVIDLYHGLCVCFLRYDLISGDPYAVLLGGGGILSRLPMTMVLVLLLIMILLFVTL